MLTYLRILAWTEALSLIALLSIAMPLKYLAGNPEPVRLVGSLHGGLFVLLIVSGVAVGRGRNWSRDRYLLLALAATLPFGAFIWDAKLFREK